MENGFYDRLESLRALVNNLPNLNERDQVFANSLLEQFARKGNLSERQWPWIVELANRATGKANGNGQPKSNGFEKMPLENHFETIRAMFRSAAQHVKWPKVRLRTEDGQPVVLSRVANGPNAGLINISDGGPYGANVWYGRIDQDGVWTKTKAATPSVQKLIADLDARPEMVAEMYGRLTNQCCFCGRELTDPRSVQVGYGPVCAQRFGLNWGEEGKDAARASLKAEFKEDTGAELNQGRAPVTPSSPQMEIKFGEVHCTEVKSDIEE